ncbi:MAG TPA: M6 family metalloprotease domain-containing protein [Candidatus Cloacimonadota bacterium]|nr:M6 family metalloprotease domain-containing protein [Candidatus Cloacimonadota bacterium]
MKNLKITLSLVFGLLAIALFSAPHTFLPLSFNQPDGTQIEIFASGDEFHNWLHDGEFYTIVQDDNGWYVYARQDGEGVAPTAMVVGRDEPRGLAPAINLSQERIAARYARYESTMRNYRSDRSPHIGQFNNLVVFIKFADDPDFSSPIGYYNNMFNNSNTGANSMKNYFLAASYDQLAVDSFFFPAPNGDVIVTYVDSHPRNYYRKLSANNPIGYDENSDTERTYREHTLLANAVAFVAGQIPTSLEIDGDNDGYVDNTCFIIQGSPDGWAELLWPHRWVLYSTTALINGARVWDFNFQLETSLFSSGASVLTHEMFHSLGAPDLYRYNDTTINPIGSWDLMSSNTNPPQHMSAWMKYRYGQWLPNPPMITTSGTYTLSPVASSSTNNIYRVNSWRSNESFVLEYRKPGTYYDDTLPGSGLLVYRLDARESGNASGPPDELYIYRPGANNTTTNGMLSMAAFSAQNNRTRINETTIPSGFAGNNSAGGLNIYNIGEAGDTITFSIKISDIQLTSPAGGEYWFGGSNKEIKWKAKTSTGYVKLEYSTNNGTSWNQIVASTPNDGSYIWTGLPYAETLEGYVRITLLSNNHTDTNIDPFAIIGSLAAPQTIYPENQAVNIPTNPLITWQSVMGATGYHFQISAEPDFSSYLVNVLGHEQPSYQMSGLTPQTLYYWRVASMGEVGISAFSEEIHFTTGALTELPGIPGLSSPVNYATNQPRNPTFAWNQSALAETYWIQIASDTFFGNLVVNQQNIPATTFTSPTLAANTMFFWRMAAQNSFGNSYFSSIRRFTTGNSVDNEDLFAPVVINDLQANYPNPFNPETTISFSVEEAGIPARLTVFNTRGQMIRTLYDAIPSKSHTSVVWDGKDSHGQGVSSGIYLYRLESGDYTKTRKMLLSK